MGPGAPTLIQLRGVEKAYRGRTALSIGELNLYSGDRVLLYGRNGSGKSTLLRLLGRISRPERGHIEFSGELRKGFVGYVPQAGGLAASLSLRANLGLRKYLFRRGPEGSAHLEELGLVRHLATRFSELSSGYQRLAAVSAALSIEPAWLLLDEPFGWLDANNRETLINVLNRAMDGSAIALAVIALPECERLPFITRTIQVEEGRLCGES